MRICDDGSGVVNDKRQDRIFSFSALLFKNIYVWTPEILYAILDPTLGAIDCSAEVTQLGATAYGAEL
jgi:hypothetical protein